MKVSAQYAEQHLTDILDAAYSGEEVEIARPDQATFRLMLVKSDSIEPKGPSRKELIGGGVGLITLPTDEEWAAMDKEIEHLMLHESTNSEQK